MGRAAMLLRNARQDAGLTQPALAARARVPQSVISEYESGRREPSVSALETLLGAVGLGLTTAPRSTALSTVREHAAELQSEFAALGATGIAVFGSVARGDDHEGSDVDLLVDLAPDTGLFALLRLQTTAERILGRSVDVVPRSDLKPTVRRNAQREAVPL
ncbi:nucleotidyltransferase domain-containing protein [Microbacterium sp. KUDC0406]|uniref:nucleotidyltransferase domain-containing protein n=1 Tax=Microbacterium sp. KUDC0406 TaxID=2909588 RepID=UPI001F164628|nr:nucleotidyltransferase domain-containing protein [Microbacterium sp. KUDC0406]UJP08762.1 nucleotidyltransferase domain-containing protein [Microbacterium sp. KUDC0406]